MEFLYYDLFCIICYILHMISSVLFLRIGQAEAARSRLSAGEWLWQSSGEGRQKNCSKLSEFGKRGRQFELGCRGLRGPGVLVASAPLFSLHVLIPQVRFKFSLAPFCSCKQKSVQSIHKPAAPEAQATGDKSCFQDLLSVCIAEYLS